MSKGSFTNGNSNNSNDEYFRNSIAKIKSKNGLSCDSKVSMNIANNILSYTSIDSFIYSLRNQNIKSFWSTEEV